MSLPPGIGLRIRRLECHARLLEDAVHGSLSNGFASWADPDGLQVICHRFGPGAAQV